ncbi:MAG: polysaccharide biosynthesis/export family protein [Candidatus Omnitrophota bacterium]|nr:polysaccharide biosynthesis/export family protein [Candidatus Omnitrophota bacterium]
MTEFKKLLTIPLILSLIFVLSAGTALAQRSEYKLQPADVLNITVHEQPDLTTKTRVTSDYYITFPLIGEIKVEGMTVQQLERELKKLLEKDYLVNAQVLVFIEEYHPRQVSVIGEVNNPGKFDMPDEKDMTLLEAIAMAGGFTEDAEVNKTRVIRVENGKKKTIIIRVKDITEKGEKEKDIILEPNDIVFVPESFF